MTRRVFIKGDSIHLSWREQYLRDLRYMLRGEPAQFVDDQVRQIDGELRDRIVDELIDQHGDLCVERTTALEAWASMLQDETEEGAINASWWQRQPDFWAAERAVLKRFAPAARLAREFQRVSRRRAIEDISTHLFDVVCMLFGVAMVVSIPHCTSLLSLVWRLGGGVTIGVSALSFLLRLLPVGECSGVVRWAMQVMRTLGGAGSAVTGACGLAAVAGTLSLAFGHGQGVSFDLHLDLPARAIPIVCMIALAVQRRCLSRDLDRLGRYVDLGVYHREVFRKHYERDLHHRHASNYFTQEEL